MDVFLFGGGGGGGGEGWAGGHTMDKTFSLNGENALMTPKPSTC